MNGVLSELEEGKDNMEIGSPVNRLFQQSDGWGGWSGGGGECGYSDHVSYLSNWTL